MRSRSALFASLAVVGVVLAIAAACGGGDGDAAAIRTQKGLSVAALAASADVGTAGTDGQSDEADVGAEAPAPAADTVGASGASRALSPDFSPYPFPTLQESQDGVTVQGFGSATVAADAAILEFYFSSEFADRGIPIPEPAPGGVAPSDDGASSGTTEVQPLELLQEAQPITEADLQPVVDAIAAQGVSPADIEVIVQPSFGDPYYGGSATVRVTVSNVDAVDGIVNAVGEATAGLQNVSFNGTNVSYTVGDCSALEQAAMQAAAEDARERGQGFASVLGVGLGPIRGASHFSSSAFGGAPCGSDFGGPYPLADTSFAQGQSRDVQLFATVTITFAIQ